MASMSYQVLQVLVVRTHLLKMRIQHNCCKKCGRPHPNNVECATRCVNCGSHTHESDCNECPAFLEMKKILKMAYLEGITVGEARTRVTNLNNASTRRLAPPARPDPQPLQELRTLGESTMPMINEKIGNLTEYLAKTNDRFDRFDQRFDDKFSLYRDSNPERLGGIPVLYRHAIS
ncbi:hypothetical protein DAPPUDRAFT_256826 [Daphnia pulex]|uniref:Uncharacterized protein n=1 Tax=Daphnia pulex TaxID=6669 RepID=E9HC63_DAPPU|nr:hypothetical protein DAPPUDRAFT_256826 [Daphnia pulex]|eukprot:EFX70709.1 hypothetical protein DAPPUDRAFT_256826 [Daphnia pulex]